MSDPYEQMAAKLAALTAFAQGVSHGEQIVAGDRDHGPVIPLYLNAEEVAVLTWAVGRELDRMVEGRLELEAILRSLRTALAELGYTLDQEGER